MTQWSRWYLCSARMQVQPTDSHSSLKDPAAQILSLAWELPYAAGTAVKKKKKKDYILANMKVKRTEGRLPSFKDAYPHTFCWLELYHRVTFS